MKKEYVINKSGIDKCALDTMTFNEGDTPDITDADFTPNQKCEMKVLRKVEILAGNECKRLIIEKGGCYYENNGTAVFLAKSLDTYNIRIVD